MNLWLTYAANTIAISTGPWWGSPSTWTLFSTITSTIKSITSAYWIWKPHYSKKIYWKEKKLIATLNSDYMVFYLRFYVFFLLFQLLFGDRSHLYLCFQPKWVWQRIGKTKECWCLSSTLYRSLIFVLFP